jgi:hypothetical protein
MTLEDGPTAAASATLPERGKALARTILQRSVAAIEQARAFELFA